MIGVLSSGAMLQIWYWTQRVIGLWIPGFSFTLVSLIRGKMWPCSRCEKYNLSVIISWIILQEIRTEPGGRDLVAGLIKLFPPSNFFVFQLSLAAGIGALHGGLIRFLTGGQFPVVILLGASSGLILFIRLCWKVMERHTERAPLAMPCSGLCHPLRTTSKVQVLPWPPSTSCWLRPPLPISLMR